MLVHIRPRLSLNATVTLTAELLDQVQSHATANNQHLSVTVRDAIYEFLHSPTKYKQPNIDAILKANPNTNTNINRNRQIGFVLPSEDTHTQLHIYAQGLLLTRSAIIRRAVYEYTKSSNTASKTNPVVILDAWGDKPMKPPSARPKRKRTKQTKQTKHTPAPTGQPNIVRYAPPVDHEEVERQKRESEDAIREFESAIEDAKRKQMLKIVSEWE
jgi:predicted transcriptional regulator